MARIKDFGQWYTESDTCGPYICENGNGRVATIECQGFSRNGGPVDWDRARLIAAVPDLLRACDEADTAFAVININSDQPLNPQARQALRDAWAKVNAAMAKALNRKNQFAAVNGGVE